RLQRDLRHVRRRRARLVPARRHRPLRPQQGRPPQRRPAGLEDVYRRLSGEPHHQLRGGRAGHDDPEPRPDGAARGTAVAPTPPPGPPLPVRAAPRPPAATASAAPSGPQATLPPPPNPCSAFSPVANPALPCVVYFPAVQHTLRGSLLTYWQQHGGLPIFGY